MGGVHVSLRRTRRHALSRLLCSVVLGVVAMLVLWTGSAAAGSFQVSPTRFEFPLDRRFTNFFTVTNNSGEPLRVRVTTAFVDFAADGTMRELRDQPLDLAPWIVFNPRRVTLQAGEKRVVRFTVRPPLGLPAGEYRTAVFFEELPERPDTEGSTASESGFRIRLLTRVGITVYGQVGELTADVVVGDPSVSIGAASLDVSALVDNRGNAHAQLSATAELLGDNDAVLSTTEERLTVQRAQQRRVRLQLPRPSPGAYRVRLTMASAERTWQQQDLPVTIQPPGQ